MFKDLYFLFIVFTAKVQYYFELYKRLSKQIFNLRVQFKEI